MAKNIKDVKHYEIYTLRKHSEIKQGDRVIHQMKELCIFDDNTLAEDYKSQIEASPEKERNEISRTFEIQATWVDVEPEEKNFSLSFNPVYAPVVSKATKVKKAFTPKLPQ